MAALHTALHQDFAASDASQQEKINVLQTMIKTDARTLLGNIQENENVKRASDIGLLEDNQIMYWLSAGYADKSLPQNLVSGKIAEYMSAQNVRAKNPETEVLVGIKIQKPNSSRRDGWEDLAEIDNLRVAKDEEGKWIPIEMVETKAGTSTGPGRLATQLSTKVKAWTEAKNDPNVRIFSGTDDITERFNLTAINVKSIQRSTATPDPKTTYPLDPDEIGTLYGTLEYLKHAGYESLRVLAI